jgi:hypothetical protein
MRPANGISETVLRRGRLISCIEWLDIFAPSERDCVRDLRSVVQRFAFLLGFGRTRSDIELVRCCVSCYQY